ncbi:MAG: YncE family protein [Mycobacterium sp.]|uniref:YncE family protein n=1 Tax=Mycobacterium sp. TaxID=1785 RepID=UPI003F9B87C4
MSKVKGRKAAHDDREGHARVVDGDSSIRIAVNRGPISDLVVSPDGGRLLVTNYGNDSVSVIDTDTRRVTGTVAGLNEPSAIAVDGHGGGRAFVSTVSRAYDAIAVLDARAGTVVATHPLALRVSDLAASPDGERAYVSRNGAAGGDLAVLDTATGRVGTVGLPVAPRATTACVRVSPDGSHLYVAANGPAGGEVFALRADGVPRVVGTIRIGLPIRDVALSPDGAIAYVASCAPDSGAVVDVIDTRSHAVTRTRKVGDIGGILTGLTVSGDGDRAYVVSDAVITVLCTLTHDIVGTVAVTDQPSRVIESPDAKWLYVADYSGAVTVTPVGSITGQELGDEARKVATAEGLMLPDLLPREPALV